MFISQLNEINQTNEGGDRDNDTAREHSPERSEMALTTFMRNNIQIYEKR